MQFPRTELEFECENLYEHPTQGNTVYALSKGCQGLTAIKAKFERLSSVFCKAIDPQDEEGTGDDLEHVPLESDDHYDIDVAEDSSMDEANQ